MILHHEPNYPSTRHYVLKLHRDASPCNGHFFGRIESVATGHAIEFRSIEELAAGLAGLLTLRN